MSASAEASRTAIVTVTILLLCAAMGGGPVGLPDPAPHGLRPRAAIDGVTVEPLPALIAEMASVEVQRRATGGAGSLVLNVVSAVPLEEVVVDLRVPEGVTLADGSRTRTWRSGLKKGQMLTLPVDLLAARDGSYVIEADIVGSSGGRTIRRGIAYTLDIGVTRSLPAFRNGAYEYRAVADHGGR